MKNTIIVILFGFVLITKSLWASETTTALDDDAVQLKSLVAALNSGSEDRVDKTVALSRVAWFIVGITERNEITVEIAEILNSLQADSGKLGLKFPIFFEDDKVFVLNQFIEHGNITYGLLFQVIEKSRNVAIERGFRWPVYKGPVFRVA